MLNIKLIEISHRAGERNIKYTYIYFASQMPRIDRRIVFLHKADNEANRSREDSSGFNSRIT